MSTHPVWKLIDFSRTLAVLANELLSEKGRKNNKIYHVHLRHLSLWSGGEESKISIDKASYFPPSQYCDTMDFEEKDPLFPPCYSCFLIRSNPSKENELTEERGYESKRISCLNIFFEEKGSNFDLVFMHRGTRMEANVFINISSPRPCSLTSNMETLDGPSLFTRPK